MYKTASRFMQRSGQQTASTGILGHEGQRFLQEVMRKLAAESATSGGESKETALAMALRRAEIHH